MRKAIIVLAPAIGLAVLAAAWSAYWYIAMARISTLLDEQASARGLDLACGSRRMSGFPHRFQIACAGLRLTSTAAGRFELAAPAAVMSLPSHNPARLNIVLSGPVKTELGPTRERPQRISVNLRTDMVPVDVRLRGKEPGDIAIRLARFRAEVTSWQGGKPVRSVKLAGAGLSGLFGRARGSGHPPGTGRLKLAARALNVRLSPPVVAGIPQVRIHSADVTALIDKPAALRGRTSSERLRRWQQASGRLYGIVARVRSDVLDIDAGGELRLDETGRFAGKIDTATTGLDQLLNRLVDNRTIKRETAVLVLTAANLVSRPKPQTERDAVHLPVSFFDGRLYYGPFGIAQLKPLF